MEWHLNSTPYHYCFNYPINFIDPFGLDSVPVSDVDWPNFDTENDNILLDEIVVKPDDGEQQDQGAPDYAQNSKVSWIDKFCAWWKSLGESNAHSGEGSGGSQAAGINMVDKNAGPSPTKYKASSSEQMDNANTLIMMAGKAGAGPLKTGGPLHIPKTIKKVGSAFKQGKKMITSDKEIIKNNTGSAVKTNNSGRQITEDGMIIEYDGMRKIMKADNKYPDTMYTFYPGSDTTIGHSR